MKYLSDYTNDLQSSLFLATKSFFAFSKEQIDEAKTVGETYVFLGHGLFCPASMQQILLDGLAEINAQGIALDLLENGKEAIIRRELDNHEAFYTYDIDDTCDALAGYNITKIEVQAMFNLVSLTLSDY